MASIRTAARSTTAVARFAHLLGISAARPRSEDEPRSPKEDDVSGKKAAAENGKKCEECGGTGKDDDGEPCEACDGSGDADEEDPEDDAKKGKKAKAKDDDDKEESDDERDNDAKVASAATAARAFERARCRAIFASPAAGVRPDVAAQLAFETRMSAKAAIGVLEAAANVIPGKAALRAPRPRVELGGGDPTPPAGAQGLAAQIIAAGKKRRGEA